MDPFLSAIQAAGAEPAPSLAELCRDLSTGELLAACERIDAYRRDEKNLYRRVRALFFLYAIHRLELPRRGELASTGRLPAPGMRALHDRRFDEAIDAFLAAQADAGPSETISSALAAAYRQDGFQTLADQVKASVRSVAENEWMFALRNPRATPLRIRPELADGDTLWERTPVRMDFSHSGWSDIFFLGMDFPEGARAINASIDLAVRGRDEHPAPPVEARLRVIDEPVLRLASVDLGARTDCKRVSDAFDFARDHLGLLRAAVVAAGVVPPGLEGLDEPLSGLLMTLVGEGRGLELETNVRGIPRGSRLAVSTTLLGACIAACMRATGQTRSFAGPLDEEERRLVAARAILGEWLGGSGGGWQDSGGLWPGLKLIRGVRPTQGDPEFGISRGRLLPEHVALAGDAAPARFLRELQESLVLVHGGMAQDVGPILEMVTERYLLRETDAWRARQEAIGILDELLAAFRKGDVLAVGELTTRNFFGPITAIIPQATNAFTETVVERVRARFGERFHGFWMLGGMSGGGMGFLFDRAVRPAAKAELHKILADAKHELAHAMPFAMDPVLYDFEVNERGSVASVVRAGDVEPPELAAQTRGAFAVPARRGAARSELDALLDELGFDRDHHERVRADLEQDVIGLSHNRLPLDTRIEDVEPVDVIDAKTSLDGQRALGLQALARGEAAVVTLAAGLGSRWTRGAGVVKALNPFVAFGGRHRSFVEVHLAKSLKTARIAGTAFPHVFTTGYRTHQPLAEALGEARNFGYGGAVHLSPGRRVGLRFVPTVRDLRFAFQEEARRRLDEQAEKVRASLHESLVGWAESTGEASDYVTNTPLSCLHPVGHGYEVPNLLLNGTLRRVLAEHPALRVLLLHNVDTLGADLDPGLLGLFLQQEACLAFEVVPRAVDDEGGGLARVDGEPRIVEGLALPREEDAWGLSYYNSMTTWIDVDRYLAALQLDRAALADDRAVEEATRRFTDRLPTYVTLKEVKERWGHGHEDVFPVAQFEKLWSDASTFLDTRYFAVPRLRGQQLKDPAQLDGWLRDGSAAFVESLGEFE